MVNPYEPSLEGARETTVSGRPRPAYRTALARTIRARLEAIARALAIEIPRRTRSDQPGRADHRAARVSRRSIDADRQCHAAWPEVGAGALRIERSRPGRWKGSTQALTCLGVEPRPTVRALLELGRARDRDAALLERSSTSNAILGGRGLANRSLVSIHPAVMSAARTVLARGRGRPTAGTGPADPRGRRARADPPDRGGLAARGRAPLRQTQQGTFYKRDRERLEDDPVLAGPIADALEPLPDMPALWLRSAAGSA